jgi:hypothetical protein
MKRVVVAKGKAVVKKLKEVYRSRGWRGAGIWGAAEWPDGRIGG